MPLEGHPLTAPIDLRDVLRVGLDNDPDAIAVATAAGSDDVASLNPTGTLDRVELMRQAEEHLHLHPHGLGVG